MSDVHDLDATQRLLWALITAPEGVAAGAAALRDSGALTDQDRDLGSLLRRFGDMSSIDRVDVYADMYFYRLHDCLAEDYPALAARLGRAHFHNLVTDYLLAHPSKHYSLRELGRALPDFAAQHELARSHGAIGDLATLEWERVDVFDELDARALSRDELLQRALEQPESFRIQVIPALRVVRVDRAVPALWKALLSEKEADTAPAGRRVPVRIWRKDFAVWHRSVELDEASCLAALVEGGASTAVLGELILQHAADEEHAMRRLAALLEVWAADGILTA